MSKKTRRAADPQRALKKKYNLKTRQDEIEIDYINKLSPDEIEYINKFNEEYVNAAFESREDLSKNLHNTKALKKAVDRRNNDRKECAYTRSKASNNLKFFEDQHTEIAINNYEDYLIHKLDHGDTDEE